MFKILDLIGKRFGKLLVIGRETNTKHGKTRWLCRCDCGVEKIVIGGDLIQNKTQSCGCLRKESGLTRRLDLTGQKFGRLIVLSSTKEKSGTSFKWKCICDCGNICIISSRLLKNGDTKSCGCLHVEIATKRILQQHIINSTGTNHPRYRHDLSDEQRQLNKIRNYQPEVRIWRQTILYLDNYICRKCNQKGGKLVAHHIHNWADYPNLRFDINNGATLCESCHKKFHDIYGKRNNTLDQFRKFLK